MSKITVAIDGHSSTGKSTVARQLAGHLGYVFVDSGAMYRAVTLFFMRNGYISSTVFDKSKIEGCLPQVNVSFRKENEIEKAEIYLNGENVEREIRTMEVSEFVSTVATISSVRKKLVAEQKKMGERKGVVMDGRDIGTIVFPNAELKIFMTATAATRARRRYNELIKRGDTIAYKDVLDNVMERDHIDTTRKDSPLVKAKDAIEIDNSDMNKEDQFRIILQLAKDRIAGRLE
jgi:cytidylate kinase